MLGEVQRHASLPACPAWFDELDDGSSRGRGLETDIQGPEVSGA
jgi:hypothetical protein